MDARNDALLELGETFTNNPEAVRLKIETFQSSVKELSKLFDLLFYLRNHPVDRFKETQSRLHLALSKMDLDPLNELYDTVQESSAMSTWRAARNWSEIIECGKKFLNGELYSTPTFSGPIDPEAYQILPKLLRLHSFGILTTEGQPWCRENGGYLCFSVAEEVLGSKEEEFVKRIHSIPNARVFDYPFSGIMYNDNNSYDLYEEANVRAFGDARPHEFCLYYKEDDEGDQSQPNSLEDEVLSVLRSLGFTRSY